MKIQVEKDKIIEKENCLMMSRKNIIIDYFHYKV
jgi:hypothetical protein